MIEKREIRLTCVVITSDNLRSLYDEIDRYFNQILKTSERGRRYCEATTLDGTQYESEGKEMFEAGGIVDNKRIASLEIRASGYSPDSTIWAEINHDRDGKKVNRIRVSGPDSTWVNGVISKLHQLIGDWEKQAQWPRKLRLPIWLMSTIGMAPIVLAILFYVVVPILRLIGVASPEASTASGLETLRSVKGWWLGSLVSFIPALMLQAWFERLWPVVELKTGQDHQQVERQRRKAIAFIVTMIVIPLLLSLVVTWASA